MWRVWPNGGRKRWEELGGGVKGLSVCCVPILHVHVHVYNVCIFVALYPGPP